MMNRYLELYDIYISELLILSLSTLTPPLYQVYLIVNKPLSERALHPARELHICTTYVNDHTLSYSHRGFRRKTTRPATAILYCKFARNTVFLCALAAAADRLFGCTYSACVLLTKPTYGHSPRLHLLESASSQRTTILNRVDCSQRPAAQLKKTIRCFIHTTQYTSCISSILCFLVLRTTRRSRFQVECTK